MNSAAVSTSVARVVRQMLSAASARPAATPRRRQVIQVDVLEPRSLFSAAAFTLIGLDALRADPAFAGIDGSGVSVAVIDTGVDFSHPQLSGGLAAQRDFVYSPANVATPTDSHGTHVAGIVGSRDPSIGVAPGTGLIGLQVFRRTAGGDVSAYPTDTQDALQWVLDNRTTHNIVAVNMSLGSGNYTDQSDVERDVRYDNIRRLEAAGITVISAAGNSYGNLNTPGSATPGIFSTLDVGAVYEENEGPIGGGAGRDFSTGPDRVTFFSQRPNTSNTVFAPGAMITSTLPGNRLGDLAGTSMASPMVAGVVALMQEAALQFGGRLLTPAEVRTIMLDTADEVFDGDDEDTNVTTTERTYPRVNAYNAVRAIRAQFTGDDGSDPTPPPLPDTLDPNGTIASPASGPALTGTPVDGFAGNIGNDGTSVVGADDVDLIRFTVAAPGTVTVNASSPNFTAVLRVFDGSGTQLGSATAGGSTVTLSGSLSPGTYYAGVSSAPNTAYDPAVGGSGVDGGATGDYDIDFALDTADADGVIAGATPLALSSGEPQVLEADLGDDGSDSVGGGDVDFYAISVPDDGTLLIDVDTPDAGGFADTYVRVFNEGGDEIDFNDDGVASDLTGEVVEFDPDPPVSGGSLNLGDELTDAPGGLTGDFAGHDTDSFLALPVGRGGTYYVAVANFQNRAFDPATLDARVTTGSTGTYGLTVSLLSRDQNGAIPQAVGTVTVPSENNLGRIGSDFGQDVGDLDVDFIRLAIPSDGILELDVDAFTDPSNTDPVDAVLRLFDEDGELLALNDDSDGRDPLLQVEVAGGEVYYAAVAGYGNDSFDPFVLGSGTTGSTGDYAFHARLLDLSQATALADDSAGGGQVEDLTLNDAIFANVGDDDGFVRGADDVDVYTFTAPFAGQFTFTADPDDDFGADTYLRLFDASGNQIAADDNGGGDTGGSKVTATLSAGTTYLVGVNGAGSNAGAYNPLTGAGAAAGDTGGYILQAQGGARSIEFGGRDAAKFTDADGSRVTISLKGPGTGSVLFASDADGDPVQIVLSGTTDKSTLSIKGDTSVGGVSVTGSLKAVSGKAVDVDGDVTASGRIASLAFRDVFNAGIATAGGGTLSLSAATVVDTTISTDATIKSIKVQSWSNTNPTNAIVAAAVTAVSSKGSFGAGISAGSVGKMSVRGSLDSDVRTTGDIGSVTVGAIGPAADVFAGVAAGFAGLPTSLADFSNQAATIKSFAVKGKAIGSYAAGANVAAGTISKASVGGVVTTNGGTPFGLFADVISSVAGTTDANGKFKLKKMSDPLQTDSVGDFVLRIG